MKYIQRFSTFVRRLKSPLNRTKFSVVRGQENLPLSTPYTAQTISIFLNYARGISTKPDGPSLIKYTGLGIPLDCPCGKQKQKEI